MAPPPDRRRAERLSDGGVRHAFWTAPGDTGRTRHELTAYVVQHAWALHVWRSLRREARETQEAAAITPR